MSWLLLLLLGLRPLTGQATGVPAPRRLVYHVIQNTSDIWIVTHRSGLLSFFGHEHAIIARDWTSRLCMSDPVTAGDEASLVVDVSSLVIDGDSARALAGLGGQPSAEERREIQRKMLDAEHLDAQAFPEARLDLRAVGNSGERLAVQGTLTLHGVQRDVKFPASIEREDPDHVRLRGQLRIRQRDFGIEPESIHGVVKVSNDVDLHFSLLAETTADLCTPTPPAPVGSFIVGRVASSNHRAVGTGRRRAAARRISANASTTAH